MDRLALKNEVYRAHIRWDNESASSIVACPWCKKTISTREGADLHEALIKRGEVPREKQDLIFNKHNCVLLHRACHTQWGSSGAMVRRCLRAICEAVTARRVGEWYVSLYTEHKLHLRKGLLIPKKSMKVAQAMAYIPVGEELVGEILPESGWTIDPHTQHQRDFRALCIKSWQGKTYQKIQRPPGEWNGVTREAIINIIDEGYWYSYLSRTLIGTGPMGSLGGN